MADSLIEALAVGGVTAMWTYLTIEAVRVWGYYTYETLKICEKIIRKLPVYRCEYCSQHFTSDFLSEREGLNCHIYVCKRCEEDEELETRYGDEKAA